jgi:RNA polymerase sigma-70 factor, ECF subfamily
MPLVYRQLQATAHGYMNQQQPAHILQSTALVNETYLRLLKLKQIEWQDRGHFYAVCAQLMRQTLIDYARSRLSLKRGGKGQQVPIEDADEVQQGNFEGELIALDDALQQLSDLDKRMSQVVQYRIFVGATVEETAAALHISEATVKREWHAARLWLARELDRKREHGV